MVTHFIPEHGRAPPNEWPHFIEEPTSEIFIPVGAAKTSARLPNRGRKLFSKRPRKCWMLLFVPSNQLQDCCDKFVRFDRFGEVCLETGPPGLSSIFVTNCSRKSNYGQLSELWFKAPDILQEFIAIHFGHR